MKTDLAIVIPAFKSEFLDQALASIAAQTSKNFTVYIGDDASPKDLYSIVKKYEDKINIVYKKFADNLGGTDLVEQWNRCIGMAQDEEWVWMFSDDDVMDDTCVAYFYETQKLYPENELFHFDINVIDGNGKKIKTAALFPEKLDIVDFNVLKWRSSISSYVVEYIFKKSHFLQSGGFEKFEYAWHTDEAIWTKLGYAHGIVTVKNSKVNWRRSDFNITPNTSSVKVVKGKLSASLNFAKWIAGFYADRNLKLTFAHKYYLTKAFVRYLRICDPVLEPGAWKGYLKQMLSSLDFKITYLLFVSYFFLHKK